MDLVVKFFKLFPRLLDIALTCTPFVYLFAILFVFGISVNVACYMIWGRY